MHWLNVPFDNLDHAASGKEDKGILFINVFVFHRDTLLLVHDAPSNEWGFPCRVRMRLADTIPEEMTRLYYPNDSKSRIGGSLLEVVLQGLGIGLRDQVLNDLQFHDFAFDNAITIPMTPDPQLIDGGNLAIVTSVADLLPLNLERNPDNRFRLNDFLGAHADDMRLCTPQKALDLLPVPVRCLAKEAMARHSQASDKRFLLRDNGPDLRAWVESSVTAYIQCQLFHRGHKLWERLLEDERLYPIEEVMRNYVTVLSSHMGTVGQEELLVWPVALEQAGTFSLMEGLDVGTYAWKDGAMRIEWLGEGVKPEWIADNGKLRISWKD